jgi:thiamine transport system permease protein
VLRIAPLVVFAAIALGLGPLVYFAWQNGSVVWPDAYAWRVVRFTLLQATASTALSVVPAVFVARAMVRQRFIGRELLLALFAVPLSLPVIVGIFGLTAFYGAAGLLGGTFNFYGLSGILLAHVFFNLPLAVRLLVENLNASPVESHRLAAQLNFSDTAIFRHVDWQVLRPALPRVAALVFLLCASSFVIVLLLGGPQATTLEVAIYQSLRMDFDVPRALTLTMMQIVLSMVLVWAASKALMASPATAALRLQSERFDGRGVFSRSIDFALIAAATVLVLPVLLSIFAQGILHITVSWLLLQALTTSFVLALLSCCIALPLSWGLAAAMKRLPSRRGLLTAASLASFIVPPAVIATGWFLAFRHFDSSIVLTTTLIAFMNALMSLPFITSVLAPAYARAAESNDRLCHHLGVQGWQRFSVVDLPALKAPLAQASMLAFVLSLGDLTAVTLLGTNGLLTLPSLVQQQMGHYQSDAAGGTALVLAALCLGATGLAKRFSRWT